MERWEELSPSSSQAGWARAEGSGVRPMRALSRWLWTKTPAGLARWPCTHPRPGPPGPGAVGSVWLWQGWVRRVGSACMHPMTPVAGEPASASCLGEAALGALGSVGAGYPWEPGAQNVGLRPVWRRVLLRTEHVWNKKGLASCPVSLWAKGLGDRGCRGPGF